MRVSGPRLLPFLLVALLVASTLAGCAERDPYARSPDEESGDSWTLEPRSYYQPSFERAGPMHVRATISVLQGGPIDVFLAHGDECGEYPNGVFDPAARLLGAAEGTLEADLPAGKSCLVLDNHEAPIGRSPGDATVRVSYLIQVWDR